MTPTFYPLSDVCIRICRIGLFFVVAVDEVLCLMVLMKVMLVFGVAVGGDGGVHDWCLMRLMLMLILMILVLIVLMIILMIILMIFGKGNNVGVDCIDDYVGG